jgi:hypothetical protein
MGLGYVALRKASFDHEALDGQGRYREEKKMAETSSHKATAERIAKRFNTEYNPGERPDIVTVQAAVKVEGPDAVKDGIRQLQGYQQTGCRNGSRSDSRHDSGSNG